MDYMDPDVLSPQKGDKLNLSLSAVLSLAWEWKDGLYIDGTQGLVNDYIP